MEARRKAGVLYTPPDQSAKIQGQLDYYMAAAELIKKSEQKPK